MGFFSDPKNLGWLGGPIGAYATGAQGSGFMSDFLGQTGRDDYKNKLQSYLDQYGQRQAPQAGPAQQSALSDFRGNQQGLISRLEAMSQGQGPSLAAQQLRAATDRNMAQQSSIAATGRGSPAMAGMLASNASAALGQQAAQQSAQARIQEQQMALGMLGNVTGQARGQDEANSQFNTGQMNQMQLANLQAKLQTMGLNDEQIRSLLAQMGNQVNQPSKGEQLLGMLQSVTGAKTAMGGAGK